jgi:hypothetical protein
VCHALAEGLNEQWLNSANTQFVNWRMGLEFAKE